MQRNRIEVTVAFSIVVLVIGNYFFSVPLATLFIPLSVLAFFVNMKLNDLTSNHNIVWARKQLAYTERLRAGAGKSLRDKVYGDLTFTIREGWTPYSLFLGISLNLFLLPQSILNPLEGLTMYVVIWYGVMLDFIMPKSPRKTFVGVILGILTFYISLRILGVNWMALLLSALKK